VKTKNNGLVLTGLGLLAAIFLFNKKESMNSVASIGLRLEPFGDDITGQTLNFNPGDTVTFYVRITNLSKRAGVPVKATLIREWEETIGYALQEAQSNQDSYEPDDGKEFTYTLVIPSTASPDLGLVTFRVKDPDSNMLASTWVSINILARVPAGVITPGIVYYDAAGLWVYITNGMEIPFGQTITIAPDWSNQADFPITGHVEVEVVKPDGSVAALTAIQNNDQEAQPTSGKIVAFSELALNQEGVYTFTASLTSGNTLLDETTFNINSVASTVYSASISMRRG